MYIKEGGTLSFDVSRRTRLMPIHGDVKEKFRLIRHVCKRIRALFVYIPLLCTFLFFLFFPFYTSRMKELAHTTILHNEDHLVLNKQKKREPKR